MSMISVTLQLGISDQLCKDLMTTAVEGGSGHWLAAEKYVRDADRNIIKVEGCFDTESPDVKWSDATLDTMREGLRKLLSGEARVNPATWHRLLQSVVDPDLCSWDAADADCVLQAGLLGSIVYG